MSDSEVRCQTTHTRTRTRTRVAPFQVTGFSNFNSLSIKHYEVTGDFNQILPDRAEQFQDNHMIRRSLAHRLHFPGQS